MYITRRERALQLSLCRCTRRVDFTCYLSVHAKVYGGRRCKNTIRYVRLGDTCAATGAHRRTRRRQRCNTSFLSPSAAMIAHGGLSSRYASCRLHRRRDCLLFCYANCEGYRMRRLPYSTCNYFRFFKQLKAGIKRYPAVPAIAPRALRVLTLSKWGTKGTTLV